MPIHKSYEGGMVAATSDRSQHERSAQVRRNRTEADQSPPLKPAQPKNAEQSTRDGRRFRNDRAIYLDVIDLGLEIVAMVCPPVK